MEYIFFFLSLLGAIILSIPFFTKDIEHNLLNIAAFSVMWSAIITSAAIIF